MKSASHNYVEMKVPMKSFLVKYIAKTHPVDPFVVTTGKCHFSSLILDPIKKNYSRSVLQQDEGLFVDFRFKVPLSENKFTIDRETVLRINQRLQSMFNQQLADMVSMTNEKKGDIFKSVQVFCDFYGIGEDDLKFETIVKMYYRARYDKSEEIESMIREELKRNQQLSLFE